MVAMGFAAAATTASKATALAVMLLPPPSTPSLLLAPWDLLCPDLRVLELIVGLTRSAMPETARDSTFVAAVQVILLLMERARPGHLENNKRAKATINAVTMRAARRAMTGSTGVFAQMVFPRLQEPMRRLTRPTRGH